MTVQNPPQLLHAAGGEDVLVIGLVVIQDPVYVEEDDVNFHQRDLTPPVKTIVVGDENGTSNNQHSMREK